MNSCTTRFHSLSLIVLAVLVASWIPAAALRAASPAAAGEESENGGRIHIGEWLLLGPVPSPPPAFHAEDEKPFDAAALCAYRHSRIDTFMPAAGRLMTLLPGTPAAWRAVSADTSGVSIPGDTAPAMIAYLAAYIEIPRWTEVKFDVRGTHPFELTVDGESVVKCTGGGTDGSLGDEKTGTAKLQRGKHLIVVKTAHVPGDTLAGWRLDAGVKSDTAPIATSLSPLRALTLGDVLDTPSMEGITVSPDGKYVAFTVSRFVPPEGTRESWIEIRETANGTLARTIRDVPGIHSLQWAPRGRILSYIVPDEGKNAIHALDLDRGTAETIVDGIEGLAGYRWSPDASFIIYADREEAEDDKTGVKRLRGVSDRQNRGRDRTSLYLSSVPGGVTRRLTAGKHSTYIRDIHPDGRSILFTRYYERLDERPYGVDELYRLFLDGREPELLHSAGWLSDAVWSPRGDRILVTGGPSIFGDVGLDVPDGMIPNEYDGQAYIFDPDTKNVEPLTRDFDPAVQQVFWSRADGRIYLLAEEGSSVNLFRCDPETKKFTRIDLDCDVIGDIDVARMRPVAVVGGSSADHPQRLYAVNLKTGAGRLILDPAAERFRDVRLGAVEEWSFTTGGGKTIQGRIHYPPDFDPGRLYPCLVNYYAGTSTTSRDFGGRYPKNLWAAMGYVVYVLQPSGATGYGQEFSAFHVNDWGKITAGEIIEGTKRFLEAHPFVDPERVGCLGASYGGFMTQLLLTRTDIFAAAVSHAGISSISSYWGEGYWGYAYNAVAAAYSFPWNRPDIYIEQSPLFYADRINTPLLLLHGASDTNVPPGESEQMYTALKLLGKPVEYIRFAGQNHFILDYKKRMIWSDAIVAWFDKWLKDEPEWWNDTYPPLDGEGGKTGDIGMRRIELDDGNVILMGTVTREGIVENLHTWDLEYFEYVPDSNLLPELEKYIFDAEITVVLGTWCSDSQREIPRLWRILEDLGYPLSEITMLAVGSSRFTTDMGIPADVLEWSDGVKARYGVERVATIIVSKGGTELGRIIETPEKSLEADLVRILSGADGSAGE